MKQQIKPPTYRRELLASAFVLALIAGVATIIKFSGTGPSPVQAQSGSQPDRYPIFGVVRDFRPGHADFASGVGDASPWNSGNVAKELSTAGVPTFTGTGRVVTASAKDARSRNISPGAVVARPVTNFSVTNNQVSSSQPMVAKITVIGAAIGTSTYDFGVTTQIRVGSTLHAPFGSYSGAVTGNVNDRKNPRSTVLPGTIQPGTSISVDARSWSRISGRSSYGVDSAWQQYMQVNSSTGGAQVRALRNGDSAPNIAGYNGQTSAKTMLAPYISTTTRKVTLQPNQVIYLFELGTTSTSSTAFDMQDLVVLVDLATDPSYFQQQQQAVAPAPKDACGNDISDVAAAYGAASSGGISSADSFAQWFLDTPNQNTSRRLAIDMTRSSSNVYEFTSTDFAPINGELYGNQGLAKNRGFTFAFTGTCAYKKCDGQFFEYTGDTDAWLFVNGQLAMDMGGKHVGQSQFVDLDRLGLADGSTVTVHFFYAQRSDTNAAFSLRTNVLLQTETSVATPAVSNPFD